MWLTLEQFVPCLPDILSVLGDASVNLLQHPQGEYIADLHFHQNQMYIR